MPKATKEPRAPKKSPRPTGAPVYEEVGRVVANVCLTPWQADETKAVKKMLAEAFGVLCRVLPGIQPQAGEPALLLIARTAAIQLQRDGSLGRRQVKKMILDAIRATAVTEKSENGDGKNKDRIDGPIPEESQ